MKNIVVIKLYRPDYACGEYHDIKLDEFDLKVKELRKFAADIGKDVYFTVCKNMSCADFDCFAEIIYSGDLSEREKAQYISIIKVFAKDADLDYDQIREYELPVSILFRQADISTL